MGGKETLVVRGEVLPVITLARLLGWPLQQSPEYGVFMQTAERSFILGVDSFAGRDDAVIKSLEDFRPKGVAGVTTLVQWANCIDSRYEGIVDRSRSAF